MEIIILLIIVAAFAGLIYSAKKGKVIVYKNAWDLFISFIPWIIYPVILSIAEQKEWITHSHLFNGVHIVIILITLIPVVYIIYKSIKINNSVIIGIIVGIAKVIISFVILGYAVYKIFGLFSSGGSEGKSGWGLVIFGVFAWIVKTLINGKAQGNTETADV